MGFEGLEVGSQGRIRVGRDDEGVEKSRGERVCFVSSTEGVEGVAEEEIVEFDGLVFWRYAVEDGDGEKKTLRASTAAKDEEELFG